MIPRPKEAGKKIELIGYERLRIYFISRRDHSIAGRPFLPGTNYNDIIRLYECDEKLREMCFAAVGQFELLLRNAISEVLAQAHGSHPYNHEAAFKDCNSHLDTLKIFVDCYQRSRDGRAAHYKRFYSEPSLPPIWTMKEFLTFGATSRVLEGLAAVHRTQVAAQFGLPGDQLLLSWVRCLVDLRNICAHHDRLFNRSFQKQPQRYQRALLPSAFSNKLKAVLECLDYLLNSRGSPSRVTAKAAKLILRYPEVQPAEAGF